MVPLHLLIWSLETGVTTLTCATEMFSWTGYTSEEKTRLAGLYLPYLALGKMSHFLHPAAVANEPFAALVMGLDMFFRLKKIIVSKRKAE